jgi:vacuolar-type H+-ATPase subunit H
MRDVIQKIIATENEAKAIVETARAEADRILSDARKKGQDIVERSRREARVEADRIVEAAVEKAERERENRLAHAAAGIESQIQLDQNSSQWAVEGVVRCVCGLR